MRKERIMDEEEIIGFEALYESMGKCQKGVLWKDSVAHFVLNEIEEILKLENQLKTGTYKAGKPQKIQITCPKKREAVCIAFRDRVYQRSLNDNAIYPALTKDFIYENFACQKGKGTDTARDKLAEFMRNAYRKYGMRVYVLQCDITGYYPNMRHDVGKRPFKENLDENIYRRAEKVMDSQYGGDVGYNPGSQMVQLAGISVLNPLDHYIKEELGIESYTRYMDDFLLIHPDREYLEYCRMQIESMLKKDGFSLNKKKTRIYPISEGIKFLGFIFKLTGTGKVLRLIDPNNVKRERRKLRRAVAKAKRGEITREKVDQMFGSWKAHALGSKKKHVKGKKKRHNSKNNTHKVVMRMEQYYKNLWKEDVHEICKSNNEPGRPGKDGVPGSENNTAGTGDQ